MPLTRRQKRRLVELTKMIDNTNSLQDDMIDMQNEYAQEIDEVMSLIQKSQEKPNVSPVSKQKESLGLSVYEGPEPQTQTKQPSTKKEAPNIDEEIVAPDWAKRLWKAIAKECHPDRLNHQSLSPVDIARRQHWFLESRKSLENQSWTKLLYLGVKLEIWVEDLSHVTQTNMLNSEYNSLTTKIQDIQTSLAWKWGTNWSNQTLRIKILQVVCDHKGLKLPPVNEVLRILVNLELD